MYQPRIVPSEPDDLPRFLAEELQRIAKEMTGAADYRMLNVLHVEPTKPRDGMVVCADGTDWNPGGTGAGFYGRIGGAWVKLG